MATTYYSKIGFEQLHNELQSLKKKRQEIATKIAEARDYGDLKENAEYAAAKEAQRLLEIKIAELHSDLADAKIVEPDDITTDEISIFNKVTLDNLTMDKKVTYHLVSDREADLKSGKISIHSLIGQGLIGKKVGEIATIKVPAGLLRLKICQIDK